MVVFITVSLASCIVPRKLELKLYSIYINQWEGELIANQQQMVSPIDELGSLAPKVAKISSPILQSNIVGLASSRMYNITEILHYRVSVDVDIEPVHYNQPDNRYPVNLILGSWWLYMGIRHGPVSYPFVLRSSERKDSPNPYRSPSSNKRYFFKHVTRQTPQ